MKSRRPDSSQPQRGHGRPDRCDLNATAPAVVFSPPEPSQPAGSVVAPGPHRILSAIAPGPPVSRVKILHTSTGMDWSDERPGVIVMECP
ncbi:hypothetical protein Taro_048014 [Colocasia esculenta]|uniref:Uncharacterized protein n=1 Tax=Colocasia esculenta TaxID=4460 RepID=A0A843X1Y6_COLES|nr:hypothetical protein [Colocasia esculenta]